MSKRFVATLLDGFIALGEGMGRIWSSMSWFSPQDFTRPPRYPQTPAEAVRDDWRRVGDHLRSAMGQRPRPTLRDLGEEYTRWRDGSRWWRDRR